MDLNEGIQELTRMFTGRDWFHSAGTDQYGRLVVYAHYMCHETLHDVPDRVGGVQVLVHFAGSLLAKREQFTDNQVKPTVAVEPENIPIELTRTIQDVTEFAELVEDKSLRFLQDELDRLERQCGPRTLQDIFYEIHDGRNAVSDYSTKFPDVRKAMEKLFQEYGFDVIYEEMDG